MGTKIVLDTNVIIAAFGWKGSPHAIFQKCISGDYQLCLSAALLEEIKRVLSYKKFGFTLQDINDLLTILLEIAEFVDPVGTVHAVANDPSDNRILECALAADCAFIITGDKHLLKLHSFKNIQIVSPCKFFTTFS